MSIGFRGIGNVSSYQVSAIPFVTGTLAIEASTGTPLAVNFYNVTRFVTVKNVVPTTSASAALRFGFSSIGVQDSNYIILDNGESYTGEVRCSRIFLLGDTSSPSSASVFAGLTGINAGENLPDSWSGSSGVG